MTFFAVHRRLLITLGWALGAVAVVAFAWSVRLPVAGQVLQALTAHHGYEARFRVTALHFGRVALRDVRFGSEAAPDLVAGELEARFRLTDVFAPRFRELIVRDAEVRARWTPGGLVMGGIRVPGPTPGGRPPKIDVQDTRILWELAGGVVPLDVMAVGDRREGWRLELLGAPGGYGAGAETLEVDALRLAAVLTPQRAEISWDVRLTDVALSDGRAQAVRLAGGFDGVMDDPGDWTSLAGAGSLRAAISGGGLNDAHATASAQMMAPPAPALLQPALGPHLQEARFAVEGALRNFEAAADLSFALRNGRAQLTLNAPLRVTGAKGVEARLSPQNNAQVEIDGRSGEIALRRLSAAITGPGLPMMEAFIGSTLADVRPWRERLLSVDGDLRMEPWTASGIVLGADADLVRLNADARGWELALGGRVAADGRRGAVMLQGAGLSAELDITGRDGVIAGSAREGAAPRVTVEDAALDDVALRDISTRLRPASDGAPYFRFGPDGVDLAAVFRDVDFLAARPDLGARLRALAVEVRHESRGVDYDQADQIWEVRAQGPRLDGRFADGARARLDGRVVDVLLQQRTARLAADAEAGSANDAPATTGAIDADAPQRVTQAAITFETIAIDAEQAPVLFSEAAGEITLMLRQGAPITGAITLSRSQIADRALLAQFAPLGVSFIGDLDGPHIGGTAQVALATSGRALAEVGLRYDVATRAGDAQFATPRVLFTPDRLQPVDIFPVTGRTVRGARGGLQVSGLARFQAPAADGAAFAFTASSLNLDADDVSLTTPLGRMESISGVFEFADIITPRTAEPQLLSMGAFDPGVPITNVEMTLNLPGDGSIHAEPVRGLLAGGEVTVGPLDIVLDRREARAFAEVEGLDLARLASALGVNGLAMSGRVSGGGHVAIDPLSLRFEDMRLAATETGALAYRPASGGAASPDSVLSQPVTYDMLALEMDGDLRNLTLRLDVTPVGAAEPLREALLVNAADVLRRAGATDIGR